MSTTTMPPAPEWASFAPGPDTVTWRRASDARVLAAAGYALLLQVSHPTVGAGVSEHSSFRRDPWGRLLRTLDYSCTMAYGGADAAGRMGARIRAMHLSIRGTRPDGEPYSALEPEAYAWVHATLAQGIFLAHERFGVRLAPHQREQLWDEWRVLGRLLGIREGELPEGLPAFCAYVEEMMATRLERTAAVAEVLDALARPAPPSSAAYYRALWPLARLPLSHVAMLATAGLLTPELRRRLGVPWGRRQELELRALSRALRAATPLMPASMLCTGPEYLRWRRSLGALGA